MEEIILLRTCQNSSWDDYNLRGDLIGHSRPRGWRDMPGDGKTFENQRPIYPERILSSTALRRANAEIRP